MQNIQNENTSENHIKEEFYIMKNFIGNALVAVTFFEDSGKEPMRFMDYNKAMKMFASDHDVRAIIADNGCGHYILSRPSKNW